MADYQVQATFLAGSEAGSKPNGITHQQAHEAPDNEGRGRRLAAWLASSLLAVGVTLILVACVGDAPAVDGNDPVLVQGRQLYINNCIGCHGADGGGGTGPKLSEGLAEANYPDMSEQIRLVAEGKNAMPSFSAKLSADELEAVTRYTREGL